MAQEAKKQAAKKTGVPNVVTWKGLLDMSDKLSEQNEEGINQFYVKYQQKADGKVSEFDLYDSSDLTPEDDYLKIGMGETRFHILSRPIVGKEIWIEEQAMKVDSEGTITFIVEPDPKTGLERPKMIRKPYRMKMKQRPDKNLMRKMREMKAKGQKCRFNIFWAMVVFNKTTGSVQVFTVSTKVITDYFADRFNAQNKEKYENPSKLDFQITKEANNGGFSKYTITHLTKNAGLTKEQWDIVREFPNVNLKALFNDEDPFLSIA